MINQNLIRALFSYDKSTGIFKRINRLKKNGELTPCDFVGKAKSVHGYLQYTVKDKTYDVHRLIFMYELGYFPPVDIDHIDGNRTNNRWENLRTVSRSVNLRNVGKKSTNESGVTGVGFNNKTKKWRVWICDKHYDGFLTLDSAISFRKNKEKELGFTDGHFKREVWNESQT